MDSLLMLAGAGFLAGAMNALAGGGSFVTLPALIAAGVPSVNANASPNCSRVALGRLTADPDLRARERAASPQRRRPL